jgi:hypothetical protein
MKNSIDTYKEAIDKQVGIISYTMNMIDVFGNMPTEVADSSAIDHLGNLFTSFKDAGKTEYSEFMFLCMVLLKGLSKILSKLT